MKKFKFQATDQWPLYRASAFAKQQAVRALIANHTLIVGQSRSGKTTAARRLIEEMLSWTKARIIILDPNADFRWLSEPVVDSDPDFQNRWQQIAKKLKVATPDGQAWGIDWGELSPAEMAAFLELSPNETFGEYRHLDRHYTYERETKGKIGTLKEFSESDYFKLAVGEELERYRLRVKNLAKLEVWASDKKATLDSLFRKNHRAIVIDLSTDDDFVRMVTVERTLEALWKQAEAKRKRFLKTGRSWVGTVIIIDEGHMFAPPDPENPRRRLVCERIQRLADQGKKLNLYLLMITQQPGKLHQNVLSEFNNRIIMRINDRRAITALESTYAGFHGRYDGTVTFNTGEALLEGALLCDEDPPPSTPRGVAFKEARTKEGGGSPKTDWALPKSS